MESSNNTSSKDTSAEKNWETELDSVRQYLLSNDGCPFPPNHIGIIAALNGIDIEMKRRFRDSKLQQKFKVVSHQSSSSNCNSNNNNNNGSSTNLEGDYYEIDVAKIDTTNNTTNTSSSSSPGRVLDLQQPTSRSDNNGSNNSSLMKNSTMTDDWEDVTEDDVMVNTTTTTKEDDDNTNKFCNDEMIIDNTTAIRSSEDEITKMTKYVVSTLAEQNVMCRHPISALAVVLHIVLLQCNSHSKSFICTGIPDDEDTGSVGGFAPPIRDLPVGQLLPSQWEDRVTSSTSKVRFRYRKIGYGTFILSVIKKEDTTTTTADPVICITLESNKKNSDTAEVQNHPLCIAIADHVNLLSWDAAAKKSSPFSSKISPVLHYKGLGIIIRTFMEHFQLSTTTKNNDSTAVQQPKDYFASHYASAGAIKDIPTPNIMIQPTSSTSCGFYPLSTTHQPSFVPDVLTASGRVSNTSNNRFLQGDGPLHGQFDGDLYPSGIPAPYSNTNSGIGIIPGNLMGPNHPIFNTRFGDDDDNNNNMDMHGNNNIGFHGMMKPRFDPFGPPGGPTEPPPQHHNTNPTTKFPGGNGNPNNDLAIPPPFGGSNNTDHNMFL